MFIKEYSYGQTTEKWGQHDGREGGRKRVSLFLATNRCEGFFFLCFVTGERRME